MTLLSSDVSTPVRDLDIPLQKFGMGERLGKLVTKADLLHRTRLKLAVWAVSEGRSLLLWVLLAFSVQS